MNHKVDISSPKAYLVQPVMPKIIDGKALAEKIREECAREAVKLADRGALPGLAVIVVGGDPASLVYVKSKRRACAEVKISSFDYDLPEETDETRLLELISKLNADSKVHGILVQLPLPKHINANCIIEAIDPAKDADGFHPLNIGRLATGRTGLKPCTPSAIMALIDSTGMDIKGKHAAVVGRSQIVGKPTAIMLLERDCTVTVCHSKTARIWDYVAGADILVAAVGKSKFIRGGWIKKDAIVIDVGINRGKDDRLTGDVDFDGALKNVAAITPVPGGVGPMTIAMLLKNTIEAAKASLR